MQGEYVNGHRGRLKEKFKFSGFSFAYDYELLELLLTYSIPRKDVKPIAKRLINHFGSLEGVFSAEQSELEQVGGIGAGSASLIILIAELNRRAFSKGHSGKGASLSGKKQRLDYCRGRLKEMPCGTKIIISLDNSECIISCRKATKELNSYSESGNLNAFGKNALQNHAAGIIIAEKQESETPCPTAATVSTIIKLNSFFRMINIGFADYVLIGKSGEALSMRFSDSFGKYFR